MPYLRTSFLALAFVSLAVPAAAAGADDLDPKVLVADTKSCGSAKTGNGPSDTIEFKALGGSMALEGAKNLCFGNTSNSAIAVAAPVGGPSAQGSITPTAIVGGTAGGGGGGGGGTRDATPTTGSPAGSGQSTLANLLSSDTGSSSLFGSSNSPSTFFGGGGGGGGSNVGAPGPEAGAGLPFLIGAGIYALVRRRRARIRS